ncbi:MAG: hypothetical protein M1818_002524 [Claussenomyces sp. TS43310]|nr:MAG: hypothetical protein M1818_002524 [Claussenomyces sp. TS43310]
MFQRWDPVWPQPKALILDLMGTCCDWHTSLVSALHSIPGIIAPSPASSPGSTSSDALSRLAADWRAGFFAEIHARFEAGAGLGLLLPPEDVDVTHRRVLDRLLEASAADPRIWDEDVRNRLVAQWHVQSGWPDALPALQRLRRDYFIVVLANGSTRLQLDIAKSSELPFHTLFSSQLLGLTKPDPAIYLKALDLMQLRPEECVMVAAHAYDLRAAAQVGMRTAYIHRTTEDLDEDMDAVRQQSDLFIDGRDGSAECGLGTLADMLGV